MISIILTALQEPLAEAWEKHCGDLDCVSVYRGSIFAVECDAVVSPANSFGFMDGGIDRLYTQHYGSGVQEELQELIAREHHGELLVGHAEIVPIPPNNYARYLISAPTMRIPQILTDTINPYLAARAVFINVLHGQFRSGELKGQAIKDRVHSVAFPGLGTGVGRVPFDICAKQVRAAIDEIVLGKNPFPKTWFDASKKHQRLYTDEVRDLQYPEDT